MRDGGNRQGGWWASDLTLSRTATAERQLHSRRTEQPQNSSLDCSLRGAAILVGRGQKNLRGTATRECSSPKNAMFCASLTLAKRQDDRESCFAAVQFCVTVVALQLPRGGWDSVTTDGLPLTGSNQMPPPDGLRAPGRTPSPHPPTDSESPRSLRGNVCTGAREHRQHQRFRRRRSRCRRNFPRLSRMTDADEW